MRLRLNVILWILFFISAFARAEEDPDEWAKRYHRKVHDFVTVLYMDHVTEPDARRYCLVIKRTYECIAQTEPPIPFVLVISRYDEYEKRFLHRYPLSRRILETGNILWAHTYAEEFGGQQTIFIESFLLLSDKELIHEAVHSIGALMSEGEFLGTVEEWVYVTTMAFATDDCYKDFLRKEL